MVSGQGVDPVILDSFLPRPFSPGHCVARNPGACVVSGQGVDPVVLDSFLPRPFSPAMLLRSLREVLRSHVACNFLYGNRAESLAI